MATCIYDNPATCRRESWVDGKVTAHITMRLMYAKGFNGHERLPFQLNVGKEFISGQIIGDKAALEIRSDV